MTTDDPTEAIRLLTTALVGTCGPDDAIALLREVLEEADPTITDACPAMGCCGCGAWIADVLAQADEMYCWACVDAGTFKYVVLPGRQRTTTT